MRLTLVYLSKMVFLVFDSVDFFEVTDACCAHCQSATIIQVDHVVDVWFPPVSVPVFVRDSVEHRGLDLVAIDGLPCDKSVSVEFWCAACLPHFLVCVVVKLDYVLSDLQEGGGAVLLRLVVGWSVCQP